MEARVYRGGRPKCTWLEAKVYRVGGQGVQRWEARVYRGGRLQCTGLEEATV